jgi:cysteine synthase
MGKSSNPVADAMAMTRTGSTYRALSARVGGTPLLELDTADRIGARLLVKLEGENPTGSVKDRACVAMLDRMLRDPRWHPEKAILDASSGNMGCSIAYFGRALGVSVHIVSSSKLTAEKRFFIEYLGATVETVGTFTIEGNEYCRAAAEAAPDKWYFLDQLHNPANPQAHFDTTATEILRDVPDVSAVVGSIGSGGTLLGTGRRLKSVDAGIKIIAVEADRGTRLPGTAALLDGDYRGPFIAEGYDEKVFDGTVLVSEQDAVVATRELMSRGLFGGLQTGATVCAAIRAVREFEPRGDVVVISGDTGWKNVDALSTKVLGRVR